MGDRIEKMMQRQKEREETMKAKEAARKKEEEDKKNAASSPVVSSPTSSTSSSAPLSKAQQERQLQEQAFEQEKIRKQQEAADRKRKQDEELKQRALDRAKADEKGALKVEGHDWLEKTVEKGERENQSKLKAAMEQVKKSEGVTKVDYNKEMTKDQKEKWANNQKRQSEIRLKRNESSSNNNNNNNNLDGMHVDVKGYGINESLYVKDTQTVGFIKDTMERKKQIPKSDQVLKFMGVELDNNDKILRDYNIYNPKPNIDELYLFLVDALQGYNVPIDVSFTKCWRDGLAFLALAHRFRGDLLGDWDKIKTDSSEVRIFRAFGVFEAIGANMVLEAQDLLALDVPDRLSIVTFLGELRNRFTYVLTLSNKNKKV
eukprot:TRINITY_DN718_c0_g1_i2.p1 TRINITY_DN718_c0_g1~~TRINITY_DN718_c0_g1_i2.p1  ORF type:complete len:374 (+),score=144.98 TRINITY_DN718_c0_g1_i2:163-1284(+)